jgi:hypothetical protein
MATEKFDIAFDKISELLEYRLNQLGEIRMDDAWQICRRNHSYGMINRVFRSIMQGMVLQNKAIRHPHRRGIYIITEPFDSKHFTKKKLIISWGKPKMVVSKISAGIYEAILREDLKNMTKLELLDLRKEVNEAISGYDNREKTKVFTVFIQFTGTKYFLKKETAIQYLKDCIEEESIFENGNETKCGYAFLNDAEVMEYCEDYKK